MVSLSQSTQRNLANCRSSDFIMRGMAGMFYCPFPHPDGHYKTIASYIPGPSRVPRATQSEGSGGRVFHPARRLSPRGCKLATPLRIRLLSTSLQSRALATRDVLFQHEAPNAVSHVPSEHGDEAKCDLQMNQPLNGWELRVIESLYELEKI